MSAEGPVAVRAPIRRLDEATVREIAAGEVVERPASVVKELVENAIDAGAGEVRVALESGGLDLVAVQDDGTGIPTAELALAVERHTTSKLPSAERLRDVATLGFRGEALAAIAQVSRLRLISRPPGSEEAHGISVVAGSVVGEFVEGRPTGTTVEVRDLFFNTPARRKFVGGPAAEQVEVASTLERLYLARPTVGLTLVADGRELARYPPTASLRDAAARVLGPEFLAVGLPFRAPAERGVGLSGVVARPDLSRSTSLGLFLAVNGRAIASRILQQAVRAAYQGYLPRGRFPVGVVHLSVEPGHVDVNVHPAKREVRLAKEREIGERLRTVVRRTLQEGPHVAEPLGRPPAATGEGIPLVEEPAGPVGPDRSDAAAPLAALPATFQRRLDQLPVPTVVAGTARHPALRLIGCLGALYWVGESGLDLVLVDQHAVSERLLFDALLRDGKLARQELVDPVALPLTPREAQFLEAHADDVRASGFLVEPFGGGVYRVLAVPVSRGRLARAEALPGMLDELLDGGRPTVPDGLRERTAATVACHGAIRAGDRVAPEELGRLLESLYALPEPAYACPHGRPILVRIARARLDRWFLRRGP